MKKLSFTSFELSILKSVCSGYYINNQHLSIITITSIYQHENIHAIVVYVQIYLTLAIH